MKPQPSGGFEWVQAAGGPALVCRALRPFAAHLFTTREWALGSRAEATDEDWEPVAASLGVDPAHLVRLHQVHGAAVVVRRAGDAADRPSSPRRRHRRVGRSVAGAGDSDRGLRAAADGRSRDRRRRRGACRVARARRRRARRDGRRARARIRQRAGGPGRRGRTVDQRGALRSRRGRPRALRIARDSQPRSSNAGSVPRARADHWLFDGWRSVQDQLESAGVPAGQHSRRGALHREPSGSVLLLSPRRQRRGTDRGRHSTI